MKPKSAMQSANVASNRPAPSAPAGGTPSWMQRNVNNIAKTTNRLQQEAKAFGVPRFWVIDGEAKQVRFVTNEPLAAIFQYRVKVRGKWRNITQPGPGEADPCAEAGMTPSYRIIFEIIDCTGYLDGKTKKRIRNIRRFWEITPRMWENIQRISKKYGPLPQYNIEVSRTGEGPQTTYTFMPEPKTSMPVSKDKPLAPEFANFFKPLNEAKMRQLVGSHDANSDSED